MKTFVFTRLCLHFVYVLVPVWRVKIIMQNKRQTLSLKLKSRRLYQPEIDHQCFRLFWFKHFRHTAIQHTSTLIMRSAVSSSFWGHALFTSHWFATYILNFIGPQPRRKGVQAFELEPRQEQGESVGHHLSICTWHWIDPNYCRLVAWQSNWIQRAEMFCHSQQISYLIAYNAGNFESESKDKM